LPFGKFGLSGLMRVFAHYWGPPEETILVSSSDDEVSGFLFYRNYFTPHPRSAQSQQHRRCQDERATIDRLGMNANNDKSICLNQRASKHGSISSIPHEQV